MPLPFDSVGLTSEGSTSSIWLRIWRMTSAPDGLMRSVSFEKADRDSILQEVIAPRDMGSPTGVNHLSSSADEACSDAHPHAPDPGPGGQHGPRRRDRDRRRAARADRRRRRSRQRLLLIGSPWSAPCCSTRCCSSAGSPRSSACCRRWSASTWPPPASAPPRPPTPPREVERLTAGFNRMLARLEEERVRGRPRRHPRPGGGARADRAGPPRRGQPGADRDPAAPAGRRRSTSRPGCAPSSRRSRRSPRRRWRSC